MKYLLFFYFVITNFFLANSQAYSELIYLKPYDNKGNQINENENSLSQIKYDPDNLYSDVDDNIPKNNIVNEKTFAYVIGNENYSNHQTVRYAKHDARIFNKYLIKTFGIDSCHISYYENAKYSNLLDILTDINDKKKFFKGDETFIFYYAGHGLPDEKTKSASLLGSDANKSNSSATFALSDLYYKLAECPNKAVIIFLDACFSGAVRSTDETDMLALSRGVRIKPNKDKIPGNLVVFSACSGDETALPYEQKKHGMFTYFLLKKIKETNGNVNLEDLSKYVIDEVLYNSNVKNKKSQNPQINTNSSFENNWKNIKLLNRSK